MTSRPRSRFCSIGAVLGAAAVLAAGCGGDDGPSTTGADGRESPTLFGVGLTPRTFGPEDFPAFLDLAVEAGEVLFHAGDVEQLADPAGPFDVTVTLGRERGLTPVVVATASSSGELLRPLDQEGLDRFVELVTDFVERAEPPYLGLGNEVNILADRDPLGFEAWMEVWDEAVDAVERVSPDTVVFPVLQYEWLLGDWGGLLGGERAQVPQWEILGRFDEAEAIGFTTYPGLAHDDPAELDPERYAQIAERTDLPVLFTEIGWQSDPDLPAVPGSEEEQAAAVERIVELLRPADPVVAVWTFVFDTGVTQEPFNSMGLRRPDGSARPAWDTWLTATR